MIYSGKFHNGFSPCLPYIYTRFQKFNYWSTSVVILHIPTDFSSKPKIVIYLRVFHNFFETMTCLYTQRFQQKFSSWITCIVILHVDGKSRGEYSSSIYERQLRNIILSKTNIIQSINIHYSHDLNLIILLIFYNGKEYNPLFTLF